jgi:hypothetical protein
MLTAEDVVRRIAAGCAYVDEKGGVGIRLKPAAAIVRELIDAHPETRACLLVGDDRVSSNPKLNNVVKRSLGDCVRSRRSYGNSRSS